MRMLGCYLTGPRALLLASFAALVAGYTVDPPAPAANDTIQDCTNWWVIASGDTCQSIADSSGITLDQFDTYNPSVGSACTLVVGNAYCIEENWGIPPPTSSTPTSTTSPTPTNGVTTPTPIQTGMTTNCNNFYLVKSGDGCYNIANQYGISLDNFYAWNPAVGNNCQYLQPTYYVCVGLIGTTTTPPTPTNGVTTPTPTQTGMVGNCNKFYDVQSGDNCYNIASQYGISLADFYAWNPAVGNNCQYLQPTYYVCVGLIGSSSATPTTTPTNGITTPTPTQTGMVGNCNQFYDVQSGDNCYNIANQYGISLDNFYAWNPAVGNNCQYLQPNYYVCVGLIGSSTPTSTTPTNGITTPTPTQSGMVSNCDAFYYVKSGDGCYNIAAAYGISLDNFYAWNPAVGNTCANLQPNYYVCVLIVGVKPSTTLQPTTTTPGNGIATPTPTQAGMVSNCNKFYYVKQGDGCYDIAQTYGIALTDFYAWNPAVKNDCSGLQPNFYVCVGT